MRRIENNKKINLKTKFIISRRNQKLNLAKKIGRRNSKSFDVSVLMLNKLREEEKKSSYISIKRNPKFNKLASKNKRKFKVNFVNRNNQNSKIPVEKNREKSRNQNFIINKGKRIRNQSLGTLILNNEINKAKKRRNIVFKSKQELPLNQNLREKEESIGKVSIVPETPISGSSSELSLSESSSLRLEDVANSSKGKINHIFQGKLGLGNADFGFSQTPRPHTYALRVIKSISDQKMKNFSFKERDRKDYIDDKKAVGIMFNLLNDGLARYVFEEVHAKTPGIPLLFK